MTHEGRMTPQGQTMKKHSTPRPYRGEVKLFHTCFLADWRWQDIQYLAVNQLNKCGTYRDQHDSEWPPFLSTTAQTA